MGVYDLKRGFILVSVILFLFILSVIGIELYKQNSYELTLMSKEKSSIDTINEMRKLKFEILNSQIDCTVTKKIEYSRFESMIYFDYGSYKNCGNESDIKFANTDGFVVVNLYTTDKINNLSSFERFYKK